MTLFELRRLLAVSILFASLMIPPRALADVSATPATNQSDATGAASPSELSSPDQLATIQRDIDWLQQEIASKRREQAKMSKDDAADAEQEIDDLQAKLVHARLSFIATASDVELPAPENAKAKQAQKRDLMQEAQDLIEPLFDAIRRVSEKPRRIEAFRSRSFYLHDRIAQIDRAVVGLDHAVKAKTFPAFDKELQDSKKDLLHERDELQVRVAAVDRKLNQELDDHRTVMQVVTQDLTEFAATKGKNLAIALLVFALTLWGSLRFKRLVLHSERVRHRLRGLNRPFHVGYGLLSGLLAVFAAVFALHFLNDWFMASLIMLGLFATLWALKTVLHHFIAELKLLLNLGTAKQGERVVWMGIPWLVKTLGFRSILVNEALHGGTVALPAATLASLLSREPGENEPWFPTKPGDFVLLDDGVYGKVEVQTPEVVVVSSKHYPTAVYLSKSPQNFSHGFELFAELSVRSGLRASSTLETEEAKLRAAARALLRTRASESERRLRTLEGGFVPLRPGRLRAWLKIECPGDLASQRDALKRELHIALSGAVHETLAKSPAAAEPALT